MFTIALIITIEAMLGITQSAALVGVDAHPVQVEVNTGEAGELKFILVGLPDAAVKESQDRVCLLYTSDAADE